MFELIAHTPIYAWILLVYLLRMGLKARKTYVTSWKKLFVMPLVMTVWSLSSMQEDFGWASGALWLMCKGVGVFLGIWIVRGREVEFDKQAGLLRINGSFVPLVLGLTLFSLHYCIAATYGFYPELKGNMGMMALELLAKVCVGMVTGRLLGYYLKWRGSPHTNLVEVKR